MPKAAWCASLGLSPTSPNANRSEIAALHVAAIVESSDDAIIGKDLNSIITSWNKGAEKIFGYTAAEMVGTSIMRLIPADRRDEENHILGKSGAAKAWNTLKRCGRPKTDG